MFETIPARPPTPQFSFVRRRLGERPVRALQLGELRFMGAPCPLELLAVGAQEPRPSWRAPRRSTLNSARLGIDPTMRFADLLPLGGGPGLEFGLLLLQGSIWRSPSFSAAACASLASAALVPVPPERPTTGRRHRWRRAPPGARRRSSWGFFHRRRVCRGNPSTGDLPARGSVGMISLSHTSASGSTHARRDRPPARRLRSPVSAALAEPRLRRHHHLRGRPSPAHQ
jgi:hypothetical protein